MPRSKASLTVNVSKPKVLTMLDIWAIDQEKRKEILQEAHTHGDFAKVLYVEGKPVSGFDTDSRLHNEISNLIRLRKTKDPIRFRINQILRIDGPSGGHLKIQAYVDVKNDQHVRKTYAGTFGAYDHLHYVPAVVGYSYESGLPIEEGYQLESVETEYTVPFSPEQVAELQQHFEPNISLLVSSGGRKYTSSLQEWLGDYKAAVEIHTNQEKIMEERLAKMIKAAR